MSEYLFERLEDREMGNTLGCEDSEFNPSIRLLGPPITLKKHVCLRRRGEDETVVEPGE